MKFSRLIDLSQLNGQLLKNKLLSVWIELTKKVLSQLKKLLLGEVHNNSYLSGLKKGELTNLYMNQMNLFWVNERCSP